MRYLGNIDFTEMTDEQIDELYRPRKTNSRKQLAILYVYEILKDETNENKHLTQNQILEILEKKYEIVIERKALGRILNQLGDENLHVVTSLRDGFWYDKAA